MAQLDTAVGTGVLNRKVEWVVQAPAPPAPAVYSGLPALPDRFIGRDEILTSIVDQLIGGHDVALSSGGVPGIGLTTLANAIAHSSAIRTRFTGGVLWATLGQNPDLSAILTRWAADLGADASTAEDEMARARAVTGAIGARRMLVVIDDAWNIADAQMLQSGGLNCVYLLTTNYRALAREFAGPDYSRLVRELTPASACELLQALAPDVCASEPDLALQVSHAAGGLPLTIKLLAGYLTAPGNAQASGTASKGAQVAPTDALARAPHMRLTIAIGRLGTPDHSHTTLQQAIALSLTGLPGRTLRAFYDLGAFVPAPAKFSRDAAIAVTQTDVATIEQLVERHLLDAEPGSGGDLSIHPVIAGVSRVRRDPKTVARHRAIYLAEALARREDLQAFDALYPQLEHAWASTPDEPVLLEFVWAARLYQVKRGMTRAIQSWNWRCRSMPHVAGAGNAHSASDDRGAELLETVSRTLEIADSVEIATGATSENSTAAVLFNIGSACDSLGRREQALEYYNRAWPLQEKGGDMAGLAITLNNIGSIYYELNMPGKALDYLRLSVACRDKLGDAASAQFGQTLNNLGVIYTSLGLAREAAENFAHSLDIHIRLGDTAGEAVTRANLAKFHHLRGPLSEAVAHMQRVVELDRINGSSHLRTHQDKLERLMLELQQEQSRGGEPAGVETSPGSMVSSTPGNLIMLKAPAPKPARGLRAALSSRFRQQGSNT